MSEPDESDDEVFGSHPNIRQSISPIDFSVLNPEAAPTRTPAPTASAKPGPVTQNPFEFPPAPVAPQLAPPAPAATLLVPTTAPTPGQSPTFIAPAAPNPTPPNQFEDLEPVSLPNVFANAFPPAPAPLPAPAPVQRSAPVPVPAPASAPVGGNPFADFESLTAVPSETETAPAIEKEPEPEGDHPRRLKTGNRDRQESDEPAEEQPSRTPRGRAAPATGSKNGLVLISLGVYALIATVLAIYGLFFQSGEKLETGHPLSTVPDNFGEFDPAVRKKVSLYKFPVDGDLPADQRAALGGKITVGEIEVQPLEITKRRLRILTDPVKGDQIEQFTPGAAFVLKLSIKNNSDISIFPMDPAFTRKSIGDDRPITRLVVNKATFFPGGPIPWPPGSAVKKKYEQQQANDYEALAPGETREYVVFTDAAKPEIIKKVEESRDPLQWRVQVRRTPIKFRGKELPVTAIIGVDFKAADIGKEEPASPDAKTP